MAVAAILFPAYIFAVLFWGVWRFPDRRQLPLKIRRKLAEKCG